MTIKINHPKHPTKIPQKKTLFERFLPKLLTFAESGKQRIISDPDLSPSK